MDKALDAALIRRLGDELYKAQRTCSVVQPLTARHPSLSLDDAYRVQQRMVARRLARDGERTVGRKIGVSSRAVMALLGVDQPVTGQLLSGMVVPDGACVSIHTLTQPRAEGEIAFLLKRDLQGPGLDATDVLAATECVLPCLEIVDSRIRDWRIRIQDTVADNASCGVFVLGPGAASPRQVDLATCGMVLEKNGEVAVTGAGAAAMGSPAHAVAWLANTLGPRGIALKAGEVILSGALGGMVPVAAGDSFRVRIGGVGGCGVGFR